MYKVFVKNLITGEEVCVAENTTWEAHQAAAAPFYKAEIKGQTFVSEEWPGFLGK